MKKEIVTKTEKIIFLPIGTASILAMVASNWTNPPLSYVLGLLALIFFAVYTTFIIVLLRRMRRLNEGRRKR